jgi:hypothetical protein
MNALAHSLRRIWAAKDRLPRLTGRGKAGCSTPLDWTRKQLVELAAIARRNAPTVILLVFNIFR